MAAVSNQSKNYLRCTLRNLAPESVSCLPWVNYNVDLNNIVEARAHVFNSSTSIPLQDVSTATEGSTASQRREQTAQKTSHGSGRTAVSCAEMLVTA